MANKDSNFPSNQLNRLPKGTSSEIVSCLLELSGKGKPKSEQELTERITSYFEFCSEHDFRPGIESLSLALGTNRSTLWNWCRQEGCSVEWAEICRQAKQTVLVFLEQCNLSGKINPASAIFYLKNWGNYVDTLSLENVTDLPAKRMLTAAELPKLGTLPKGAAELPDLRDYEEDRLTD